MKIYLLGILTSVFPSLIQASEQPNIILLLADDLGWADLGYQGSEDIRSPHIDKLANNGIRFTDGHVSASVCSPSRAGLMTGRYQQRFGHEANSPPPTVCKRRLTQFFRDIKYRVYHAFCMGGIKGLLYQ